MFKKNLKASTAKSPSSEIDLKTNDISGPRWKVVSLDFFFLL